MKPSFTILSLFISVLVFAQEPGFEYHFRIFDKDKEVTNKQGGYLVKSLSLYGKQSQWSDSVRYFDWTHYRGESMKSWHLVQAYGQIRNFVWLQVIRQGGQSDTMNILFNKQAHYAFTDNIDWRSKVDSIVFQTGNFFVPLWNGTPSYDEWSKLEGLRLETISETMFDFIDRNFRMR